MVWAEELQVHVMPRGRGGGVGFWGKWRECVTAASWQVFPNGNSHTFLRYSFNFSCRIS